MAASTAIGDARHACGRPYGRENSGPLTDRRRLGLRIAAAALLLAVLAAGYFLLRESGALARLSDGDTVRSLIEDLGILGPVAVVVLLAAAIVMSPVPSAPIALAAGAAYGHTWGTVLVVAGAEIGALVAFAIARLVGYETLRRWFGDRLSVGLLGSQNALTAIVFASRLLPFVSFDLISYAAGLTPLAWWRFALATLAGIIPASFVLAHFGSEMASGEADRIALTVLALGALTLVPLLVKVFRDRKRRGGDAG